MHFDGPAGASVLLKETTTSYDVLSRPTVTTVHDAVAHSTRTTAVSYPAGGSAETVATVDYEGATTTVVLDGAGRESSRSSETSAGTLLRDDVEYDSANRATSWRFRGLGSSRSFDDAAHVTSQQGEGWAVAGAHYQYDSGTGRKASESLSFAFDGGREETDAYSYSDAGRLVSATVAGKVTSYDHDAAGNLTAVTADGVTRALDYPDANRLASVSVGGSVVTTFTWDADNGRRIAQGPLCDADQIRYSYNDDGRLAAYANDATGVSATYTYDVHGQRSTAAVSEGAATTAYAFTYEGLTLLRYDAVISTGATETASSVTYLYDGESRPYAGVYASGEATPVAFGIITTDRGDVRELTDGTGTPFAFYAYDAYGMPLAAESTATASVDATLAATIAEANVLRYAGYCFDEHSGMYYLSQRYYDPATCQFITKDPAKADGEESAYRYCGGDPVGKVDPSGERSVRILIATRVKLYGYRLLDSSVHVDLMRSCGYSHVGCHYGPPAGSMGSVMAYAVKVAVKRSYVIHERLTNLRGRPVGNRYRIKTGWSSYRTYYLSGSLKRVKQSAIDKRVTQDKRDLRCS